MKKLTTTFLMILLFSATINAQNNFKDLWLEVAKFEVDGLPKSALNIVDEIYEKATKANNSPQIIKTLFYKSKFALTLEEDAQLKVINNFKEHISKSDYPTKNVLENILANLYWQYFNENRYQFYNRTKVANTTEKNDDFRTWDLDNLFSEIHCYFEASLQNETELQKIAITDFDDILQIKNDAKTYSPTLFDFLANNALQFYKTTETSITKPAYQFQIDSASFLGDESAFAKLSMNSKDILSLQLNALKVYQKLIAFHLKENNKNALAEINIQRLNFVNEHAIFNDKESVLLASLISSKEKNKNHEASALYAFEIAKIYRDKARSYSLENTENRFKNKEAIAICNAIIKEYPTSLGAKKCSILKAQIEQQTLSITAEEYIPIDKNSRLLVTYTNIEKLFFTAYKISESQFYIFNNIEKIEEKQTYLNKLEKVTNWQHQLRNEHDYLQHTTEVIVPKFKNGLYLIIASESEALKLNAIYGTAQIQATNLTLIENNFNEKYNYQIVDRNTGKPIKNAEIHLKNSSNDEDYYINKKLKTDKNGFATFNSKNRYSNVAISVKTKHDFATFGSHYFYKNDRNNYNNSNNQTKIKPFIFTDRSIYRPGQTVYFKAIAIKKRGKKSEIYTNQFVEINLYDANNQVVKTLDLKLNEFGSVAGEFVIPNNGLTGEFSIEVEDSLEEDSNQYYEFDYDNKIYFSVEEYKRPKFETEFKPITESFKINDSVTINGFSKAFSGANITDAKVIYRVHRKVQFPSWYYWRRPNFNSTSQEITNGESVTDAAGNFLIQFKAIPDESVSKESLPVFTYEITADVTDINGETRSATSSIKVGYHSLLATISLDDKIDKTQKETIIKIDTKNLNDEFVAASGTLKIYKLQAPKTALRKRPWSAPDYQDISENEFRTLFPNEAFTDDENDDTKWQKETVVYSAKFDTSTSKEIVLKNIHKWISGKYMVVLESKDKFNQEVKDEKRVTFFSSKENEIADKQLFTINTNKLIYAVNDVVEINIGSASKNMTAVVQIEKNHTIIETHLVQLNNNTKTIKVPVNKEDIGGFAVKYHFVNYNYFESGNLLISVPEKQESIEISTNIFRDKLQPGQDETWSFTIKDDKNDAIAAEVLASMYDASLDAFKTHNWYFNPITPKQSYYSYHVSRANKSFDNTYFVIRNLERNYYGFPTIASNNYNWFGFSLSKNNWLNQQYLRNAKRNINSTRTVFDGTITGFIADKNGDPLPGVNVVIKGTTFGTETDFDGNYTIKIKTGDVLTISYLGFTPQEISVYKQTNIDVLLIEDASQLDEVVVTGYAVRNVNEAMDFNAVQKKEMVMGSAKMLKGKAAGLLIDDKEIVENIKQEKELSQIQARKNFNETAFFFPQLRTDKNGKISFNFTMPEALTKWKLQLLAYNKELKSATKTLYSVTQKELMVVPNAPRFLREKDTITLSAKITNLTNNQLSGVAKLLLTDAISGKEIDIDLQNTNATKNFTVDKDGNTSVSWSLSIPETVQAVQYKIVAKAGDFSDGEQNVLPVLSNRMLVTESVSMWIRANETKTFTLDKLKNTTSTTLKNHKLTLEMTSNPVWYAIQSLPYLMEYPHECAEQTFSRYYANTLASFVANSNPKIQEVFNAWKSSDAFLSNLEKNEELKSLIIQETPWLRDAQSESEQKKRIALLFDLSKMKNMQEKAINKLQDIQMSSGGFPWFKGGRYASDFITQHIATGFGHLQKLGVTDVDDSTKKMIEKSVKYLDRQLVEVYENLIDTAKKASFNAKTQKRDEKIYKAVLKKNNLTHFVIQYLYMRSFYVDLPLENMPKIAVDYYQNQTKEYWNEFNLYAKGQIALSLFRADEKATATKILKSLKENAITSDELGMYWKSNTSGYYFYQAPIETQALMIETFSEIENEITTIDNLKIWLLKNKQTNSWKTTKATTEAVYALLLNGSDWISVTDLVAIKVGNEEINPSKMEAVKVEAGTGYFKTSWNTDEIKPEMATVTINKKGNGIAWGGFYRQYFEDLDKITSAETALKINKKLFLKVNADAGKELKEINKNTQLKVGDLITVRIELQSDRDLEFIHMKDMRAAGVEPINVLSKYKWQDNLGYYESTKDAATNFFFDRLPKGVYVFEYDVRVNNAGNFSNGITTIQSMYAPEFSSHSKGIRIQVSEK